MTSIEQIRPPEQRLKRFIESDAFKQAVTALILINAVVLGALTFAEPGTDARRWLMLIDNTIVAIFVIEIALKLVVWRTEFFRKGWNIFDFVVIGISLISVAETFSILRALRVFRILRLLHVVPMMRRITEALFRALPGMGAIIAVLMLLIYVGSVIATDLFGATSDPEVEMLFGDLHSSALSLFQVMTMDGWRNEVLQKVMDDGNPYAWVFFMAFIFIASFAVLNLFIALFVDALQAEHELAQDERIEELDDKADDAALARNEMMAVLKSLQTDIQDLRETLSKREQDDRLDQ
ncbi:MAG: ion transporter [Pseudomonadota bacterium]